MAMSRPFAEISGLSVCIVNTDAQIDAALDQGNRRQFRLWCQRRQALLARRERALLEAATAEVDA
jgi:hypothetical protein